MGSGLLCLLVAKRYGTASNIKSRVNRLSVLGAITSTQQRLKLYTKVPPNGLVLYCGLVVSDEGLAMFSNAHAIRTLSCIFDASLSLLLCLLVFEISPLQPRFSLRHTPTLPLDGFCATRISNANVWS